MPTGCTPSLDPKACDDDAGALCDELLCILAMASRDLEHSRDAVRISLGRATLLLRATMQDAMRLPAASPRAGLLAWQIQWVMGHIETHLDRAICVADLAQLAKLSESHFSRLFRLTFLEPPHLYLARRRIEYAGHLLLSIDAPLREIGLECGFSDPAHFCKRFHQFMGEAPGAWRRRQRSRRIPGCDVAPPARRGGAARAD